VRKSNVVEYRHYLEMAVRFLFSAPALIFLGAGSPEGDLGRFQGPWSVVDYHNHGIVLPREKLKLMKVNFKHKNVLVQLGKEQEEKFTFAHDAGTKPKSITLVPENGSAMHGIYEFKDGKLTIGLHLKGAVKLDELGDLPFSHLTRGSGFMAKISPSEFPLKPRPFFALLVLSRVKR
jgi:uncharacterized protein (TIGR03067 family)